MEKYPLTSPGDLITPSDKDLSDRLQRLEDNLKTVQYPDGRKKQIEREMAHIYLELCWRLEDACGKLQ